MESISSTENYKNNMPHTTAPGSSGAPIIHAHSGALIGIHMFGRPVGLGSGCLWIHDLIDQVEKDVNKN